MNVIKIYKNGEIQNYSSTVSFCVPDIESARNLKLALIERINENTD